MRFGTLLAFTGVFLVASMHCFGGDSTSFFNRITNFPDKFLKGINSKSADLQKQLTKQTEKYLADFEKREEKLKKKLYKQDSNTAKTLYSGNPEQQYALLLEKFKKDSASISKPYSGEYMAYIDSLKGCLSFLNKNPQLLNSSKLLPADISNSLNNLQQLQAKFQAADLVKQFIQQRKQQISQYLNQFSNLPSGISNTYNGYSKQFYYYSAQVKEYKDVLNDPDKMLKTALGILNKLPVFTSFMKNNSVLAGLLNIPNTTGSGAPSNALQAGMATRDQVMSAIQGQAGNSSLNATALVQQNVQSAQGEVDQLRNKLNAFGTSGGDIDVPNFTPNNQKTKTFLQRLEYGTNMQTAHSSYFFPTTTDLALSLGYKIDSKNVVGVGASYKIGWGSDISHINLSSQGVGLRSFLDLQVKKGFFASGGFEYNYQQPFYSLGILNSLSSWQQSGLVGVSKIVSMNTKIFKKTKLQLLWDFLSYQQIPKAQPFKFRVGYSF